MKEDWCKECWQVTKMEKYQNAVMKHYGYLGYCCGLCATPRSIKSPLGRRWLVRDFL